MYNLIFFYMFKLAEKRNPVALYGSAGFVIFVQFVHILLLFSIIKVIFNIQLPISNNTCLICKLLWILFIPFPFVWAVIVSKYYEKRYKTLAKLYEGKKILTLKNTIIVFSLILVPLIIATFLLQK